MNFRNLLFIMNIQFLICNVVFASEGSEKKLTDSRDARSESLENLTEIEIDDPEICSSIDDFARLMDQTFSVSPFHPESEKAYRNEHPYMHIKDQAIAAKVRKYSFWYKKESPYEVFQCDSEAQAGRLLQNVKRFLIQYLARQEEMMTDLRKKEKTIKVMGWLALGISSHVANELDEDGKTAFDYVKKQLYVPGWIAS